MKVLDGNLVRLARLSKGWTLKELASRSQISISYLSHVEKNRRSVPTAVHAVLDLELETAWLFKLFLYLTDDEELIKEDKDLIYSNLLTILNLNFKR